MNVPTPTTLRTAIHVSALIVFAVGTCAEPAHSAEASDAVVWTLAFKVQASHELLLVKDAAGNHIEEFHRPKQSKPSALGQWQSDAFTKDFPSSHWVRKTLVLTESGVNYAHYTGHGDRNNQFVQTKVVRRLAGTWKSKGDGVYTATLKRG
jgi:hypothetical protein